MLHNILYIAQNIITRNYIFFIICSIFGYYASFKFNLKYIYIYFTYQIINALLWISICIYDDILQFSEDLRQVAFPVVNQSSVWTTKPKGCA